MDRNRKKWISLIRNKGFEILVIVMILLHLIPIWRFKYFPSQDGPSHIYNTQILKDFSDPEYDFGKYYRLNLGLFPNWACYALMLAFQSLAPPLIAEKIFLTIYVIMFAVSFYYLLGAFGHRQRLFTLLGFMYIYNFLFLMGFYNFSIGVPFLFLSLGYWWKYKESIGWKSGILLNLLLIATFFSHLVPYMLSIILIFLLSIAYFRKRLKKIGCTVLCLTPSSLLLFNYVVKSGILRSQRPPTSYWNMVRLISDLISVKSLVFFNTSQETKIGYTLSAVIVFLFIITITRKLNLREGSLIIKFEEKDYFLLAFIVTFALYIYLPDGIAEQGGLITMRFNLFSSLFIIPMLSEDMWRKVKIVAFCLMIILVMGNLLYIHNYFNILNADLEEYNAGVEILGNNVVMMPLIFDKVGHSQIVQIFTHAPNYYCLDNGNINIGNYEAAQHYFPINFRDDFERPTISQVHYTPHEINYAKLSGYVDYIVAFGENPDLLARVMEYYKPIMTYKRLKILKRK